MRKFIKSAVIVVLSVTLLSGCEKIEQQNNSGNKESATLQSTVVLDESQPYFDTNIHPIARADRGYEQIFGEDSTNREMIMIVLLVFAINMIISKSIVLEYRRGMNVIVRSTANGRRWLTGKKVAACIILVLILYLIVYGIDFYMLIRDFGMPYINAPLPSLTFMGEKGLNITILAWILMRQAAKLTICLIVMALALVLSRISGKRKTTAFIPFVIIGEVAVLALIYMQRLTEGKGMKKLYILGMLTATIIRGLHKRRNRPIRNNVFSILLL